jgi:hypothetical protein
MTRPAGRVVAQALTGPPRNTPRSGDQPPPGETPDAAIIAIANQTIRFNPGRVF